MSGFGVEIVGLEKLAKQLAALRVSALKGIEREVALGALDVQSTAVKSIQKVTPGSRPGRRRGKNVNVSPDFEAPNTDTGRLVQSIQVDINGLDASVGTNLEYGAHLEFGTSKMAPRPWLQPAFEKNKKSIIRNVSRAIKKAIK